MTRKSGGNRRFAPTVSLKYVLCRGIDDFMREVDDFLKKRLTINGKTKENRARLFPFRCRLLRGREDSLHRRGVRDKG